MQENRATGAAPVVSSKKNGPVAPEKTDAAVAGYDATKKEGETSAPKKKTLSNPELLALFKEYEQADHMILQALDGVREAKRRRSKIVERISEGSDKKSFKLKESGRVYTVMSRPDEKTGERFFYFRTPGEPETLEI